MTLSYSGTKIDITPTHVDKIARTPQESERLYKQYKKQEEFHKTNENHWIKTPKIFSTWEDMHAFAFRMEFIDGKDVIDHLKSLNVYNTEKLATKLITFIVSNTVGPKKKISSQIIFNKYNDVTKRIKSRFFFDIKDKCDELFLNLPEYIELHLGYCHGDFTLANMIFKDETVYLIDFLDSFFDAPIHDIVKLRQDTKFLWSCLLTQNTTSKVHQNLRILDEYMHYFFKCGENFPYKILEILNLIRIFPYSREPRVDIYLKQHLTRLLCEI